MKIIFKTVLFSFLLIGLVMGDRGTYAAISEDKSEFILNLIEKVEWPAESGLKTKPFEICVIGNASLAEKLTKQVAKISKPDLKIVVRAIDTDQEYLTARIVVIAIDDLKQLAGILKNVKDKPILTVGESEGFARYGVMINIIESENAGEFKLIINKMTSRKAGLEIDPDLIKKADKTYG
jgi:hypothetical protein